jgi:hypothetical protein
MCCIVALGAMLPRLTMILMAIFGSWFNGVFPSWILPVIGWFLLPYTTLTYVLAWNFDHPHGVHGFVWFFVALAFVFDLVNLFGGYTKRQQVPGYPSQATY